MAPILHNHKVPCPLRQGRCRTRQSKSHAGRLIHEGGGHKLEFSLSRDLEVNPPGIALALDLMDQIETLNARLLRKAVHG